jgi:hypothetical protein
MKKQKNERKDKIKMKKKNQTIKSLDFPVLLSMSIVKWKVSLAFLSLVCL